MRKQGSEELVTERQSLVGKALPASLAVKAGDTFGMWSVLSEDFSFTRTRIPSGKLKWVYYAACKCQCGTIAWVGIENMVRKLSTSCGCESTKKVVATSTTHGMRGDPLYAVWNMIVQRTTKESSKVFHHYGGRGIDIDPRWLNFSAFYEDVGNAPFVGATLERVDNSKGYWSNNLIWADRKVQMENTRRSIRYDFQGHKLSLTEASYLTGISKETLSSRVYGYGWSFEKAVTTPVRRNPSAATLYTPKAIPESPEEVAQALAGCRGRVEPLKVNKL